MDGNFGVQLSLQMLKEKDYRGEMLVDHSVDLMGNNAVLCITAPDRVKKVHRAYLEAGADIIRTNTCNANSFGQSTYRLENMAYDIAKAGAAVAREAVIEYDDDVRNCRTGKLGQVVERKFVAGCIGGLPGQGSGQDRAGFRELVDAFGEQVRGLLDGGADILLLDGVNDALEVKAALYAIDKVSNERGELVPIMVSGLVSGAEGRLSAGQAPEALRYSVSSYPIFCIGFEAAGGESDAFPHMKEMGNAPVRMCVMENVDLAKIKPHDSESVKECAKRIWRYSDGGLVSVVGGDRNSNPETVRFFVMALKGCRTRRIPARRYNMLLSGLDPMDLSREGPCMMVGKDAGARILAVNLDEGGDIVAAGQARGPVMVESSKWDVLVSGLECVQGKGIARSISLAEGEEIFLVKAAEIRKRGFAVVCFAEDENGRAETFERETAIIERMYRLLIGKLNFQAEDIVFEPNVVKPDGGALAVDPVNLLFKVCRYVKANLPYAHVLGDFSMLGLAFYDEEVQAGLRSVFLHHAKKCGLDFIVMEAERFPVYEEIPYRLSCLLEDCVLSRTADARQKLNAFVASR